MNICELTVTLVFVKVVGGLLNTGELTVTLVFDQVVGGLLKTGELTVTLVFDQVVGGLLNTGELIDPPEITALPHVTGSARNPSFHSKTCINTEKQLLDKGIRASLLLQHSVPFTMSSVTMSINVFCSK